MQFVKKLGRGTYGVVYLANHPIRGSIAAKKFASNENEGVSAETIRELDILSKVDHPNVLSCFEVINSSRNKKMIALLPLANMDLRRWINKYNWRKSYDLSQIQKIFTGLNN